MGSVYNADNMPPYALPDNKTQTGVKTRSSKGGGSANFNEIRFEDKKGSEDLYVHAERTFTGEVEADETRESAAAHHHRFTKDDTETVETGNHTLTVSKGNRLSIISEGDDTLMVTKGERDPHGGDRITRLPRGGCHYDGFGEHHPACLRWQRRYHRLPR